MCGRFTLTLSKADFLKYLFKYEDSIINLDAFVMPNYNIAPSEPVVSMINHQGQYRIGTITWGFVPSFIKDLHAFKPLINARAETILTKKSFKDALKFRRCVVFADSFYEWKTIHGKKVPYRILTKNQEVFAFAALWGSYKSNNKIQYGAVIITTKANNFIKDIHERMPVILDEDEVKAWLSLETVDPIKYLNSYSSDLMSAYPVSSKVNSALFKVRESIEKKELS